MLPKILRCKMCFISHFPIPRICKRKGKLLQRICGTTSKILQSLLTPKTNQSDSILKGINNYQCSPKRFIGGGKPDNITKMLRKAISSAKKHGINLSAGQKNNADGNCTYESVILNINERDCYAQKLHQQPNYYRKIWINDFEKNAVNYPEICAGFTDREKKENWNKLKQPKVYEVPVFGDYVLNAIAQGCKKNILIFNTSLTAADPIYVIRANEYGGITDSDIPVVLAYNQHHYESLHPISLTDIERQKNWLMSTVREIINFLRRTYRTSFLRTPILVQYMLVVVLQTMEVWKKNVLAKSGNK